MSILDHGNYHREHTTTAAEHAHQFMRILLLAGLLLAITVLLNGAGSLSFTWIEIPAMIGSFIVGWAGTKLVDRVLWYVAELLFGDGDDSPPRSGTFVCRGCGDKVHVNEETEPWNCVMCGDQMIHMRLDTSDESIPDSVSQ